MLIVDAHLDLAMNALEWNRDLSRALDDVRSRESHLTDKPDRGRGTISFDEMRRGGVGLCVATQIARYAPAGNPYPGWHSQEQAWATTQGQLAWYRAMEERGELVQIASREALDRHLAEWSGGKLPRGSDTSSASRAPTRSSRSVRRAGVRDRACGPSARRTTVPASTRRGPPRRRPMGARGHDLLRRWIGWAMILDATHLCDDSFRDAMDRFHGPVWASHSNCRALVPTDGSSPTTRSAS